MRLIPIIILSFVPYAHAAERIKASEISDDLGVYENEQVILTGVLDLNHFESINIDGVHLDWECKDKNNLDSNRSGWDNLMHWEEVGLNGQLVEIKGTLIYGSSGGVSLGSIPVLHEYIKSPIKEVIVQCTFPQR